MSYGFYMNFKQVKDRNEALSEALNITKSLWDKRCEYINDLRTGSLLIDKLNEQLTNAQIDAFIEQAFRCNFIFWEKYNLLGCSGYLSKVIYDDFDSSVYFQNSTDNDYHYSTWSNNVELFKKKKVLWQTADTKQLLGMLGKGYTEDEVKAMLEYYRKSCLYRDIFQELYLEDYLYDNPCDKFERFSMSAIDSYEKKFALTTLLLAKLTQ